MSINNHARQTLLGTFTGVAAGGTKNLTSTDLGDIFGPNADQGGYANLTDLQDDIVVIRKFAGNYLNEDGSATTISPTADEAWRAWTYPYDIDDAGLITDATSGSAMYNLTGTSTNLTLEFPVQDLLFTRNDGISVVKLPPITEADVFYIIRKTKNDNKLVTFEPSARITANNLNTALDQNFFLGQEAEMWFQNFHKISPAIGQPNGIANLDASGLIPTEYIAGRQLSRSDADDAKWDAQSHTITNLPLPTANEEAATKRYVDAQSLYDGVVTPQQTAFTITSSNAGENKTYTYGTDYTDVSNWAQIDEEFFIVTIDGVLQIPDTDFKIETNSTVKIVGWTNEGDVISVRNIGRGGTNLIGDGVVTSTGSNKGRTLAARFAERYNILDFAVDGYVPSASVGTDTTINAAPTWNAAITGIAAVGGGTLYIPRGYYHFTTQPNDVTGGINIEGEGLESVLVKRYSTGTGEDYRGMISLDSYNNNNTYIKRLSFLNYEDGSESTDDAAHPGNGSAISIVADFDLISPGNVWIDDIHCSAESTSGSYKYWKCGIFIDGSKQYGVLSVDKGVRGIYINGCTLSANSDAAIKGVGVNDLFIQGCTADKGRTVDEAGNRTVRGLKLEGGNPSVFNPSNTGVVTTQPSIMNCNFESSYGIEIGADTTHPNRADVSNAHFYGNIGEIHLGANATNPMIVGTQTDDRTIDTPNEKYTLLTSGAGETSHSHIYGGLRLRGQGLTVGNVNSGAEIYLPEDGNIALYGKLEISKSTAPSTVSPVGTVKLYSDQSVAQGNLYARFDTGDPVLIAGGDGYKTIVLGINDLLEDQPSGQNYWIRGTDIAGTKHSQAPDTIEGETWWIINNYSSSDYPDARYPIARGWNLGAGGWTRTQYSGRVNELYNGGTQEGDPIEWLLTSGGPAETYTVSNATEDRTYDANSTTEAELADVLGTLINDLRAQGIVK